MLLVRCFRGRESQHEHEHAQLEEVVGLIRESDLHGPIYVLSNFLLNNGEIDCVVLAPHGPVILDFKAYRGEVWGTENGDWTVVKDDGAEVPIHQNVFEQLRIHRRDVIDRLIRIRERHFPHIDEERIPHIGAWAYFQKGSTYPDGQINTRIVKWFDVITAETLIDRLARNNAGYTWTKEDLDRIVEELRLTEYGVNVQSAAARGQPDLERADATADRTGETGAGADAKDGDTAPVPLSSKNVKTRADAIENIKRELERAETRQSKEASEIPPGPQRIRGIAGSGKTYLLCRKAAEMHRRHPDWTIALVFYNQSLYGILQDRVRYECEQQGVEWDPYDADNTLHVVHAWGGKTRPGLYSMICHHNGVVPRRYSTLSEYQFIDQFAMVCRDLLSSIRISPQFDAILVDEGQDFIIDQADLLYDRKQPFYWMAFQALRPHNPSQPMLRRLIFAYDEYQNINTLRIPSTVELFGDEPEARQLLTGNYLTGIPKSRVMKQCYRTPLPILTAAHAIGMGMFYRDGMLAGPTTRKGWENLGYTVDGEFKSGHTVTLNRTQATSPRPYVEAPWDPSVEMKIYPTREEELEALGADVRRELHVEGLDDNQILVVSLIQDMAHLRKIAIALESEGINFYIAKAPEMNTLYWDYATERRPDKFRDDGAVSVTGVPSAKGNEAELIYVTAVDYVAQNEASINHRNLLFTAMTRSLGWVKMSGVGRFLLYDEIQKAVEGDGRISFTYRPGKGDYGRDEDGDGMSYQRPLV